MTEAAWRHIDSVTKEMFEEGWWLRSVGDSFRSVSPGLTCSNFCELVNGNQDKQVYGPIPEPPKPPPKLRRFEAVHGLYGRVSGVQVNGESYIAYFPKSVEGLGTALTRCEEKNFTDIRWIDPE